MAPDPWARRRKTMGGVSLSVQEAWCILQTDFQPIQTDMKLVKGEHPSTPTLRARVRAVADDSFASSCPMDEAELPPLSDGWLYDMGSLTMLMIKGNVEPHTDPFVSNKRDYEARASIFWLLADRSKKASHLVADGEAVDLSPGEWALFEDAKLHAFMAQGVWVGVAIQVYR